MNCPECGAADSLCRSRFDEFLVLEFTDAGYGAVHHLTVTAFMLQHSSQLTREGWAFEREILKTFLEEGTPPAVLRRQMRGEVASGRRSFRIKSRDGRPVIAKSTWDRTILDVRVSDAATYCTDVTAWAASVLAEAQGVEPLDADRT